MIPAWDARPSLQPNHGAQNAVEWGKNIDTPFETNTGVDQEGQTPQEKIDPREARHGDTAAQLDAVGQTSHHSPEPLRSAGNPPEICRFLYDDHLSP
jgi:hypothetical protein